MCDWTIQHIVPYHIVLSAHTVDYLYHRWTVRTIDKGFMVRNYE